MENPFMKFYTRDWQADSALRQCSAAARGVWIELLCIMTQNDNGAKGHLCPNGRLTEGLTVPVIARLTGLLLEEVTAGMGELDRAGVFSKTDSGVIFSRRMVKEAERSRINKENGDKGGNPRLTEPLNRSNENSVNQKTNPHGNTRNQKLEANTNTNTNTNSDTKKRESAAPAKPEPQPAPKKGVFGQFVNVKLTPVEMDALIERFGPEGTCQRIDNLSGYIASKGEKYKSHYATLLQWEARDKKEGRGKTAGGDGSNHPPDYYDKVLAEKAARDGGKK